MPSLDSSLPSEMIVRVFESYSQALVRHTSVFLLRHYAMSMRSLHLDPQAVTYFEEEAQTVAQHMEGQDVWGFPPAVPTLFEVYSRAIVMHTAAFLLRHHAITMRGLHLDTRAVAYLEKEAQAIEQQMDSQDIMFPDLLDTAVLDIMRAFITSDNHWRSRAGEHFSPPLRQAATQP